MFEFETVGPFLVRELKWEGHGPPVPPSGYAPAPEVLLGNGFLKIYSKRNVDILHRANLQILKIHKSHTPAV